MPIEQGTVVIADDTFEGSGHSYRPYIVISNGAHPFYGAQYLCMSVSTNDYGEGVELHPDFFADGSLDKTSYACPWTVLQINEEQVREEVGELKPEAVEALITKMFDYIHPQNAAPTRNSEKDGSEVLA